MRVKTDIERRKELLGVALYNGMAESEKVGQGAPLSAFVSGDFQRLLESLGVPRYGHCAYISADHAPIRFEPCAYTYLPPSYVVGMSAVIYDAYLDESQTMALLDETLNLVSQPLFDPETGYKLRRRRMSRLGAQFIMLNQLYAQGDRQRSTALMDGDDEAEAAMVTFRLAANEWLPHNRAKRAIATAVGNAGLKLSR